MLTQELIRELLHYDSETGLFTWKVRPANSVYAGDIAGSPNSHGHIVIRIKRKGYFAHRLAFLYMTGELPEKGIDHKDRNRANNRWKNLRPATPVQNGYNAGIWKSNTSGVKGVCWNAASRKWQASIKHNGIAKYLGLFETLELAAEFRQLAAEMLHGEFVNHGG